jgi:hypothetical protein
LRRELRQPALLAARWLIVLASHTKDFRVSRTELEVLWIERWPE